MTPEINPVDGRVNIGRQYPYQHHDQKKSRQAREPWNPHADGSE